MHCDIVNVCVKGPCIQGIFYITLINWNQGKTASRSYKIRICINAFSYKNLNDEFGAGGLLYKSVQNLMLVVRYILNFSYCEYFAQNELFLFNDLKC